MMLAQSGKKLILFSHFALEANPSTHLAEANWIFISFHFISFHKCSLVALKGAGIVRCPLRLVCQDNQLTDSDPAYQS